MFALVQKFFEIISAFSYNFQASKVLQQIFSFITKNNRFQILVSYFSRQYNVTTPVIPKNEQLFDKWRPPTFISLSRISHEKMPGFSFFISSILFSISGVAVEDEGREFLAVVSIFSNSPTRGLLPPITPGLIEPVS